MKILLQIQKKSREAMSSHKRQQFYRLPTYCVLCVHKHGFCKSFKSYAKSFQKHNLEQLPMFASISCILVVATGRNQRYSSKPIKLSPTLKYTIRRKCYKTTLNENTKCLFSSTKSRESFSCGCWTERNG